MNQNSIIAGFHQSLKCFRTMRNGQSLAGNADKKLVESKFPLGYVGEPVECAGMAVRPGSEAGRPMTGQDISTAGGMSRP